MGTHYSPQLVHDGLVFCTDFANNKSYPGSGNTLTDLVTRKTLTKQNTYTFTTTAPGLGYFAGSAGGRFTTGNSGGLGIALTTELSIGIWYKKTGNGFTSNQRLVELWSGTSVSAGHCATIRDSTGKQQFWLNQGAGDSRFMTLTSTTTRSNNIWRYYTATYGSPNAKIYMDGVVDISTSNASSTLDDVNNICIGAYASENNNYHFEGNISIVQVYNREFSASEVRQNFNSQRNRFGV